METKINSDSIVNQNWDLLLKMFHKIISDNNDNKIKQLEVLKELTKTKPLTPRQMEGIIERCTNAINGSYGNTKKPEHYSQAHNFSTNGQ